MSTTFSAVRPKHCSVQKVLGTLVDLGSQDLHQVLWVRPVDALRKGGRAVRHRLSARTEGGFGSGEAVVVDSERQWCLQKPTTSQRAFRQASKQHREGNMPLMHVVAFDFYSLFLWVF